ACSTLLLLPGFVCRPEVLRSPDVSVLPFFRPSAQENNQVCTIVPEVDAVAWAIVDAQFQRAATHAFHVGHIALRQAGEGHRDFPGGTGVEVLKPLLEGAAAVRVRILPHFDHDSW